MIKIYFKLALNAIRKNRILFLPYIVASSVMGILTYLITAVAADTYIRNIQGGNIVSEIFGIGTVVIAFFAIIFNVYLSLFISRKRRQEYGVLSVLGMEKKHLIGLIFVENLLLLISNFVFSVFGGIAFYKVFQLSLLKVLNIPADNSIRISSRAVFYILGIYLVVYLISFVIQSVTVSVNKVVNVINSSSKGERRQVTDYILGIVGFVMLIWAYVTAMKIPSVATVDSVSYDVISNFVLAVIVVIAATFLVFISGSVFVLSLLKKNKNIYYRKSNFINLSGLSFRMRKNGVALGAVCILFTMVMVSVSGILSFYSIADESTITRIGNDYIIDDFIQIKYPDDFDWESEENPPDPEITLVKAEETLGKLIDASKSHGVDISYKTFDYFFSDFGYIEDGAFVFSYYYDDITMIDEISTSMGVVLKEDAENYLGEKIDLKDGEIGFIQVYEPYSGKHIDKIRLSDGTDASVINLNGSFGFTSINHINCFLVLAMSAEEADEFIGIDVLKNQVGDGFSYDFFNPYGKVFFVDVDTDYMEQYEIAKEAGLFENDENGEFTHYQMQCVEMIEFYSAYRGLLFVAFSIISVFVIMSIIVLYYKNVFDAYDDLRNFQIMRKVGLDDSLVIKTVYSQMIISTLLPILVATIHTVFAERFIGALLSLFELKELEGFGRITLLSAIASIILTFA